VLASVAALPTKAGGAEIAFSLSAPAEVTVTVLNIAGRPVATVARGLAADSGAQRLLWSGQSSLGTPAPRGTYVVRIAVWDSNGQQATGLCMLKLER
jgi:hypothetical protein